MTLIDRLRALGLLWAAAHGRELSTLGTLVAKDGKFFACLADGKTCTVTIFERFLAFFREPGNWPEESIPADAAMLLDEVEMIAAGPDPAVGREMQIDAHQLMAPARLEWPLASSGKGGGSSGPDRTSLRTEADSRRPFGAPAPVPSSPTCTPTSAPPPPPADSPASSVGEAA
ncbi:MAG TPA: hypothetical protein VN231_05915 [Allosphingosinicella sp.]|nr:hypothetical protein [Allosphingosinicella sp.]